MSLKRPPNEVESKLHQAALSAHRKELTGKQAESLVPDLVQRQNALNFLLGVGLLKVLVVQGSEGKGKGKGKEVVFRAVGKEEVDVTKGLTGEENLVLSHIKSAGNEGIWTKHLKSKTSLHQTIIDRCLKTLTQKRLIKRVQSVQHITRKIYMLEGLEPSSALTGGPWYTDNELDAEFIRGVGEGCWRIVWDVSFPKRRNGKTNTTNDRVLYPPSNAPAYPTAEQIRNALKKARLTDTELTVEHVEMVLNVLVLDGKIEKLPAFNLSVWNDMDEGESTDEDGMTARRKRKKRSGDSDSDEHQSRKKKKRKERDDETGSDSDERDRRKGKKKKGKGRLSDEEEEDGSGSDTESAVRKKKKKSSRSSSSSSHSPSPSLGVGVGGGTVYRALLEPPSASSALVSKSAAHLFGGIFGGGIFGSGEGISGLMGAPCGACPVFDFCKVGGPANPKECVYYDEWMTFGLGEKEDGAEVKMEV